MAHALFPTGHFYINLILSIHPMQSSVGCRTTPVTWRLTLRTRCCRNAREGDWNIADKRGGRSRAILLGSFPPPPSHLWGYCYSSFSFLPYSKIPLAWAPNAFFPWGLWLAALPLEDGGVRKADNQMSSQVYNFAFAILYLHGPSLQAIVSVLYNCPHYLPIYLDWSRHLM